MDYCNLDVVKAFSLAPTHKSLKELQEWITSVAVDLKNKGFREIQEGHAPDALWYLNHALSLDPQDWIASFKRCVCHAYFYDRQTYMKHRGLLFQNFHAWDNALEDFLTVLNNPDRDTQRDSQVREHIAQIYETMGLEAYQ